MWFNELSTCILLNSVELYWQGCLSLNNDSKCNLPDKFFLQNLHQERDLFYVTFTHIKRIKYKCQYYQFCFFFKHNCVYAYEYINFSSYL